MLAHTPIDNPESIPMAVSQNYLDAGKLMARRRALFLIQTHALAALDYGNVERHLYAARGLDHARELGRQHGFAADVECAIQLIQDLTRATPDRRAADLRAMLAVIAPSPKMREAAE